MSVINLYRHGTALEEYPWAGGGMGGRSSHDHGED